MTQVGSQGGLGFAFEQLSLLTATAVLSAYRSCPVHVTASVDLQLSSLHACGVREGKLSVGGCAIRKMLTIVACERSDGAAAAGAAAQVAEAEGAGSHVRAAASSGGQRGQLAAL